ncbi:MAG: hypothetical protein HY367_00940 [Candidatus Aenigmarchaeota archaeon]|nr:hypothetical protein [Candidatus Aenigmarchaeota archaeon]
MEILFICRENRVRSQMAQAFFNRLSGHASAESAGTDVGGYEGEPLNEFVVACMNDLDVDLSEARTRQLTPAMAAVAGKIISFAPKDRLPGYLKDSRKVIFWDVEEADENVYIDLARVRDRIKGLVEGLIKATGHG